MTDRIIILARHATHDEVGRVLSGRSQIALNAAGRAEASALARSLEDIALTAIYSSPRLRAGETAAAVAHGRPIGVSQTAALDEIDFGAFTGRTFDALEHDAAWQIWNAERSIARCPGGETMEEAVSRALGWLHALPVQQSPVLCVTHCDIIRGVVAHVRGVPFEAIYGIGCDPASRTMLRLAADGTMTIMSLNTPPR